MPRYAELVYNGFWFSPERRALQAAIDETQQFCTGTVRVKLYKVCSSSFRAMHGAWCPTAWLVGCNACAPFSLYRCDIHNQGIWLETKLQRGLPSMTDVQ